MSAYLSSALTSANATLASATLVSIFPPAVENTIAEVISWLVILLVPLVLLGVFWWLHIMPEKIAERRNHPQAQAIKALCLLSLLFGGLLWPLAWLWAYTKPVFYKMAYGVDEVPHGGAGHTDPLGDASPTGEAS